MKIRLGKMSFQELIAAARGEFEVDVTPEVEQAILLDAQAARDGLATKMGDSNSDAAMASMVARLEEIPALVAAAVKAALAEAMPASEPLVAVEAPGLEQPIAEMKASIEALRGEVVALMERASQAAATAEAVKSEATQAAAALAPLVTLSGRPMTAEMKQAVASSDSAGQQAASAQFGRSIQW